MHDDFRPKEKYSVCVKCIENVDDISEWNVLSSSPVQFDLPFHSCPNLPIPKA